MIVSLPTPAQLLIFPMHDGSAVAAVDACGDADDLFVDEKRQRGYLSCGDGYLDVFEASGGEYRRTAHIPTISGAMTSLFVPEVDRVFLAARSNPGPPSAIWVLRPMP